jgi:hypothetical protein
MDGLLVKLGDLCAFWGSLSKPKSVLSAIKFIAAHVVSGAKEGSWDLGQERRGPDDRR